MADCNGTPFMIQKVYASSEPGSLEGQRPALNLLSYRGSCLPGD